MNPTTEQHAIDAGLAELYDRYYQACLKAGDDDILDYDAIVVKFSKLVAGRCVELVNGQECHAGVERTAFFKGHDQVIFDCRTVIKQTFGL